MADERKPKPSWLGGGMASQAGRALAGRRRQLREQEEAATGPRTSKKSSPDPKQ